MAQFLIKDDVKKFIEKDTVYLLRQSKDFEEAMI